MPTLEQRRRESVFKQVKKCVQGRCPIYFKEYFKFNHQTHARATRQSKLLRVPAVRIEIAKKATISDNNIGQWLPFSPIPPVQCCFADSKKYRKKSRHHWSNIERGEAGEGFLLRVARDFWLGL